MDKEELQVKFVELCNGEKRAFEEIYENLKTPVYTIVLRMTRSTALSEDILQEIFLKLYRTPPEPPVKNPRAYIFQMARNLAIDSMRKQKQGVSLDELENTLSFPMEDYSLRTDIETALKSLSPEENQIVTLHVNGELKFREISGIMGIPLGTVLWKYQKAIGKLRSKLSGGAL